MCFNLEIRDLEEKFNALAEAEVDFLLKKNRAYIKESKLFSDGGEYSVDEVAWYESMISEIDTSLNAQKQSRLQRIAEI